jgi:predicted TIM-barrel fold metal-dependent hydrolase
MYPIIDAHTHIEGLPGCEWQDPPELIVRLLDEAGIDRAVVMTYVDAPMQHAGYDPLVYVREACAAFPERLIGFARLDPGHPEAPELLQRAVCEWGFQGLKLHPFGYRQLPDSPDTLRLLRKAGELGIPTLFHCGDEEYTLPLQLERAARQCPESALIFGHMGGYFHVHDAIAVASRCPNVWLETSATPHPERIREAVGQLGAERVIFGSDGPGCDPTIELQKVRMLGFSEAQLQRILSDNIQGLLARRS